MSGLQLVTAVAGLDVGARALLDLWLRQGIEDVEIAAVLGARPGDVAERRAQVLHRLMFETGAAPGGGREALVSKLRSIFAEGGPALVYGRLSEGAPDDARERVSSALAETADEPHAEVSVEGTDDGEEAASTTLPEGDAHDSDRAADKEVPEAAHPEPPAEPPDTATEAEPTAPATATEPVAAAITEPQAPATTGEETAAPAGAPSRSRIVAERRLVIVAAAALLAIGALVAGALLGDRPDAPAPSGARPAPPPAGDLAWVELNPMPAAAPGVEGMAALAGDGPQQRLEVRVSGLPEPASRYRVWLSNPPGLTPVGRLRSNSTLSVPLQADPSDFRFVFVLLDEKWGGPRGALAIPTEELLSAGPARGPEPAPAG